MTAAAIEQRVHVRRGPQRGDIPWIAAAHGINYANNPGFDSVELEAYCAASLAEFVHAPEGGALWIAELDGEVVGSVGITRDSESRSRACVGTSSVPRRGGSGSGGG